MKKFLVMVLAMALALAPALAANALVAGTNPEFQPFEFMDDDENVIGFDADLAAELSKDLGVEIQFESTAFDSIVPGIASGKYDLGISGFYITEERLMNVDFSIPYLQDSQSCIVKAGGSVTDEESLKGKKIGSQTGTLGMESAEEFTDEGNIFGYNSALNAIMELQGGKLDAVITDTPVANRIVKELNDPDIMILDAIAFEVNFYGVALPKGSALKAQVDASIQRMLDDGTIDALVEKWDIFSQAEE